MSLPCSESVLDVGLSCRLTGHTATSVVDDTPDDVERDLVVVVLRLVDTVDDAVVDDILDDVERDLVVVVLRLVDTVDGAGVDDGPSVDLAEQ